MQQLERLDEAIGEAAADAAARELDDVVLGAREQRAVDAELAELVADHRDAHAPAARVGEQVANERRLARAEEARDQHDRNARAHEAGSSSSGVRRERLRAQLRIHTKVI